MLRRVQLQCSRQRRVEGPPTASTAPGGLPRGRDNCRAPQTVQVMPARSGYNTLSGTGSDPAGNESTETYTSGSRPAGTPKRPTPSTSRSTRAGQGPRRKPSRRAWRCDPGINGMTKTGMQFNGTPGMPRPAARCSTRRRASPSRRGPGCRRQRPACGIIASQAGAQKSGFELYCSASLDRWAFDRYASRPRRGRSSALTSASAPGRRMGALVGVYDAVAKTLSLYVNGKLAQTVATPRPGTPPAGSRSVRLLRRRTGELLFRRLDDMRVFDRVLTARVQDPSTRRPLVAARWKLNDARRRQCGQRRLMELDQAAGAARARSPWRVPGRRARRVTFGTIGKAGKAVQLNGLTGICRPPAPVLTPRRASALGLGQTHPPSPPHRSC